MRRDEKDIKWIEVDEGYGWEKRILIEELPKGYCLHVDSSNEEDYYNYEPYQTIKESKDFWRYIKEPTFRPYQELTEELVEKLIGKLIKNKKTKNIYMINGCLPEDKKVYIVNFLTDLSVLFNNYTFLDGSPIGEEVTE